MRFYDREQEITFLRETRDTAEKVARFTVVTGRRRIGKTTLIREAYKDAPFARTRDSTCFTNEHESHELNE